MKEQNNKIIFGIVTAIYWFALYTYVPILSPYAQSLGATESLIGLIVGSYGFTQTLIRIPLGIASDTLKKRKLFIIMGLVVGVVSALGPYIFRGSVALLFFRGLSGVAAASWVAFTVLFTSYFEEKDIPKALGIINSYNYFGQMTAMFIGGWVAQSYGQENTFLLATVVGVIGIVLSFSIRENKNIDKVPLKIKDIFVVARNKNLIISSSLAIVSQVVTFATVFGFTPIIAKNLGANSFQLGLLSTLSTLPMIFASSLSGTFFANKIGVKYTIIIGFIISALSCVVVPLSSNLATLYITQMIGGVGRGITFPLLMSLGIKNVESNKRATAMGFFQAIYGIGMFAGPSLVGLVGERFGLASGFIIISLLGFIGAAITQRHVV